MIEYTKRKATSILENDNDTEDLEYLPSVKRQRITIEAMEKLFEKFSINEEPSPNKKEPETYPNKFLLYDHTPIHTSKKDPGNKRTKNDDNNRNAELQTESRLRDCHEVGEAESEVPPKVISEEGSCPVKRAAEGTEEGGDSTTTDMPRTKKVRHLKRGLRLCSSITCYIEQVVY